MIYACPAGIVNFFFFFNVQNPSARESEVRLAHFGGEGYSQTCLLRPSSPRGHWAWGAGPRNPAELGRALFRPVGKVPKPEADAYSWDQNAALFLRPVLPPISLGLPLCMPACLSMLTIVA